MADDPWLRLVEELTSAARAARLKAGVAAGRTTDADKAEMVELAGQLRWLLELDPERAVAAPVQQLALQALADLCGPDMLNRPDDLQKAKSILKVATAPRLLRSEEHTSELQ